MYKASIILLMLFSWYQPLTGQDSLDIVQWIDGRRQILGLDKTDVSTTGFRPSWIRELEFRTETEDFEPGKQEYLFRFSPSTPRIRRAQSRLIELAKQELGFSQIDFRQEVMKYILEELLEIRNTLAGLTLQRKLLVVYEDEQKLISNLIVEKNYNFKDLLQIESAIQELTLDIENQEYWVRTLADNQRLPATGRLISVEAIAARLEQTDWSLPNEVSLSKDQLDIARVEAEISLGKAEQNRILDFIQLRYDGPHADLLREKLAVGIGLELPYASGKKLKLEELRVEQLLREQELRRQKTLDSLKVADRLHDLRTQLARWQLLKRNLDQQTNKYTALLEKGLDIKYDAPDLFLFQREAVLKMQLDLLALEEDIYTNYLSLLVQGGVLRNESNWQYVLGFILEEG